MTEASNDTLGPWLEVTASDGTEFSFASPESALTYFVGEAEKWAWVLTNRRGPELTPSSGVHRRFRGLADFKQQLAATPTERKIREAVEFYLRLEPAVHDRTPTQRKLLEIAARNQAEAFWTLVWLGLNSPSELATNLHAVQQLDFSFLAALANSAIIRSQATATSESQGNLANDALQELNRLRNEAGLNAEDIKTVRVRATQMLTEAQASIESATRELSEASKALQAGTTAAIEENNNTLEAKWKQLTATYDNKLALQAPSTYWRNKQAEHKRQSQAFATAAIIFGIFSATTLFFLFGAIFQGLKANQIPTWGQVLSATVAAVIVLWVIKTLVRLTMSHIHLALDAEERRTMILSYLAMSKLADATPEERKGLLAAIFRPTGDGIVKDETPPLPIFELFKAGK